MLIVCAGIEKAERQLSQHRVHFHKREKEYHDAKADYEASQVTKEKLTNHLQMIIMENEKRKEEKLNKLMEQLNIGNSPEPTHSSQSDPPGFKGFSR